MQVIQALFNFYIKASLHVALSATALTGVTALSIQIPCDVWLLVFVFCGTVVCYNFVKYGVEVNKYNISTNICYKGIQSVSVICLAFALYSLSRFSWEIWIVVVILSFISVLYTTPLPPLTRSLRRWRGFKIYIVALVWTGITVCLPLIAAKCRINWDLWVLGLQRFVLIVVLLLPFEIRDLPWDDPKLRTLPQVLGVKSAQRFGVLLLVVFFGLTLLRHELTFLEIAMRAVLSVVLTLICLFAERTQSRYFASFWVEAIPIVWFGLWIWGSTI